MKRQAHYPCEDCGKPTLERIETHISTGTLFLCKQCADYRRPGIAKERGVTKEAIQYTPENFRGALWKK